MTVEYENRENLVIEPKYVLKRVRGHEGFVSPLVHTFSFALAYAVAHAG